MKNIQKGTRRTGGLPGLMAGNVVSSLSARLQEVTERFRKEQGDYLKCEFYRTFPGDQVIHCVFGTC